MKSTQQNLPGKKKVTGRTDDIDEARLGKEQVSIPVVEEKLQVGKETIEKGGVRVEKTINERPATEQVELREEHVNVERRSVDRPAEPGDLQAFQEGTVEFVERSERPLVTKEARVVEEVVVNKNVESKLETVSENVRYTTVKVEEIGTRGPIAGRDFNAYDQDFRTHFGASGYGDVRYEDYLPAYQYGYDLSAVDRYRGRAWEDIESDAMQTWEKRNPGTWEKIKGSVRHAWGRVTGKN